MIESGISVSAVATAVTDLRLAVANSFAVADGFAVTDV